MLALIAEFERLIRRDPAGRGLIGSEPRSGPLCPGHLAAAAAHLAGHAGTVAIATGFFVPAAEPPAAETDGPPGALLLASALRAAGREAVVLTDDRCVAAVRAAARACDVPEDAVHVFPEEVARKRGQAPSKDRFQSIRPTRRRSQSPFSRNPVAAGETSAWIDAFFTRGAGRKLTHLIAVERVGPSHTPDSLSRQHRDGPVPLEEFLAAVPPPSRDRCHNMRGEIIDAYTAPLHRLFEELPRYRPEAKTIGIGDGGNEIGMGCVPWEELRRRLEGEPAPRIPCRIAADWNIVAGVSNWGAYALAAAVVLLTGRVECLRDFDREQQRRVLERMVDEGPAVDGATRRREATVDGLPFLTYIQPWQGIRRLLGLKE